MGFPQVIGRYEIIDELGRGAMGSVFKAKDPAVGRIVALKTIHSAALAGGQSEEYRARFYREARASGVLAHPGIVPVFDVGEHDGAPFLVMEFVDGRTLDNAMKKGERFTLDRTCEIGQQIADALGYAHRQGVIHRDIKPANILMTSREIYGSERPRITDFGIAKLAASEITTTGQLLGTPSFMPPEQFTGTPIDGRADLFSLGVILYSMATGEQPFPGETMTAVSYKVVYTEPIPPSKLNPAIPPRLEAVILKCLAKNPAERYQTGEEIAQDLAAIRANTGATALSPVVPVAGPSDATLGPGPLVSSLPPAHTAVASAAVQPSRAGAAPQAAVKKAKKPLRVETVFAVALLGVAALGVGGWFLSRLYHNPPVSQQASNAPATPPAAPVSTPTQQQPIAAAPAAQPVPPASAPARGTSPAAQSKPAATKPQTSTTPPVPVPAANPPANPAANKPAAATPPPATPAKAPAVFDPRKLDPNANAKIKINLASFPNGIPFTVEMNKQPYLHFITGDGSSLDNLYVPPGVQQFRVSFKSNGQEWDSNIVSEDFKAKKKKTMKIQLLIKDKAAQKITLPIGKDAQLFLSISTTLTDNLPF